MIEIKIQESLLKFYQENSLENAADLFHLYLRAGDKFSAKFYLQAIVNCWAQEVKKIPRTPFTQGIFLIYSLRDFLRELLEMKVKRELKIEKGFEKEALEIEGFIILKNIKELNFEIKEKRRKDG